MAQVPYPITEDDAAGIKRQVWQLIRELYEDRIAGFSLGDVFEDGGDVLSLRVADISGLAKVDNELLVDCKSTGGLEIGTTGISIKCKAAGGLATDANGIYIDGSTPNGFGTIDCPSGTDPVAATGAATLTLTGSGITVTGDSATDTVNFAITDDAVTNAKLANMATTTIKGRTSAGTGDPEDLTAAEARGVLGLATTDSPTFTNLHLIGADIDTNNDSTPRDLTIDCGTDKTIVLTETVYEDLQVSMNNIAKGASAPTDRTYAHGVGSGIAYPVLGFAKDNYIWFDIQSSHTMKISTVLDCHIHFVLPNTTTIGHKIVWQLDVIAASLDGTWAVPAGSPYTATHTVASGDDTSHRTLSIGNIAAVNTTVSTVYKCKLTRIDGTATEYASEVYLEFVDCHYQKDTVGSRQIGTK